MPLLAAVLVVNHRRRTIQTRVVPLTHPQLWQIKAGTIAVEPAPCGRTLPTIAAHV
jgi:hypothetical protein